MKAQLLTRSGFRKAVFARDSYHCVMCSRSAQDAHHIIERKLFDNGGYYLDNGVSLCEEHHRAAEATTLGCDILRLAAGIQNIILPKTFDRSYTYDKWGGIFLPNGMVMILEGSNH